MSTAATPPSLRERWLKQRIPAGAHTVNRRSVFILPTRQGFYLAFFLVAMLVGCINYNLSLGYLLTFFLFSVGLGAMYRTHQNLLGLHIELLPSTPVFAGQTSLQDPVDCAALNVQLTFSSSKVSAKYGLQFDLHPAKQYRIKFTKKPRQGALSAFFAELRLLFSVSKPNIPTVPAVHNTARNTPSDGYGDGVVPSHTLGLSANYLAILTPAPAQILPIPLNPLLRGEYALPALRISTTYPLGLWRAWSYVFPADNTPPLFVYPELPPDNSPPAQPVAMDSPAATPHAATPTRRLSADGDAVSHLEGSDTASMRRLHWAALARGLVAQRVLEGDVPLLSNLKLSFESCTVQGIEPQLSQLCAAVLSCQHTASPFVLQLNQAVYPPDGQPRSDTAHIADCLAALARYS
jgi:hypothetical protein